MPGAVQYLRALTSNSRSASSRDRGPVAAFARFESSRGFTSERNCHRPAYESQQMFGVMEPCFGDGGVLGVIVWYWAAVQHYNLS
jgi:hypothetical protein